MGIIEIWLIAASLAMDCFSISVASGVILRRIEWRVFLKMALLFGVFQAAMPVIGWACATSFSGLIQDYDHWIAFGLLAFLGGRMIREAFKTDCDAHFDPTRLSVMLTLAVATSIDALAVGISFAFTGFSEWIQLTVPILAIGFVSLVLSLAGSLIGATVGRKFNCRMELVGGVVLIALGTKILLEHTGLI